MEYSPNRTISVIRALHINFLLMRYRLNRPQALLLILFWIVLCYIVLVSAARIDSPLILTLIISGALVFIPIYKRWKK